MVYVQNGRTLMHLAAINGCKEVAEWLFSVGVPVTDKDQVLFLKLLE